jgi:hypothetical protein
MRFTSAAATKCAFGNTGKSFMNSKKENKNKENTEISLNPHMSHTCAAVGQTKTEQSAPWKQIN